MERVIKAVREGGVRQAELARRSGVSKATISQIVAGIIGDPRTSTAAALNRALDQIEAEQAGGVPASAGGGA